MRDDQGRFQPGASGNPRGRPRGKTLSERLRKALTIREQQAIIKTLIGLAKAGDLAATKLIFNYVDGLPVQKVEAELQASIGQNPQFLAIEKALLLFSDRHPELRGELEAAIERS